MIQFIIICHINITRKAKISDFSYHILIQPVLGGDIEEFHNFYAYIHAISSSKVTVNIM